ncbi:MAG: phosphopantetheine-binding protein [Planctomycetota bacterium]|nr:phosphopantetheine-binding protein [Planctomycetota bacterium]
MANSLVTRERIDQEVRAALATTLRIDANGIGMEQSIINDLGATSIDFLDINFRLEQVFGIRLASQLLLDHVEEELGEGTAIDRDNKITAGAAALLREQFPEAESIKAGIYADEVPAVVTPGSIATAVEKIIAHLPDACPACSAASWKSDDSTKVACGGCGKDAEYPDGDELTKRWIHDMQREKQLFANA